MLGPLSPRGPPLSAETLLPISEARSQINRCRMPLSPTQRAVASRTNLERAWLWVKTNPEAAYRKYYRHLFRAFSISADELLRETRDLLLAEAYEPDAATKIYVPKKS